ncbi:MAG: hypothetical protein HY824_00170 [Acidobacteria bacterium]|nr:hypothetical protein [Acidobacteriota bacterium]
MPVLTGIEPTARDLDDIVDHLRRSWTATMTVRRQSGEDVGYREIFVSLDGERIGMLQHGDAMTRDIEPGTHRLQAHNTLFWKTLEFTVGAGEHATFRAANTAGWGTYSVWALLIGFLGAGPLYVSLERQT